MNLIIETILMIISKLENEQVTIIAFFNNVKTINTIINVI